MNHDLLLAKRHAYGFDRDSLKVLHSYLSNRYQRAEIHKSFSLWSKIIFGVPQVLGPLLFNIYINDLFYMIKLTNMCNFSDYTTLHACDPILEHDANLAIEWFDFNYMKLNQDKCLFLFMVTNLKQFGQKLVG